MEEKNRVVIDTSPRGRLTSLLGAMNLDTAKPMVDEAIEEAIQAERQKREEMVEAERERFGKILSEIEIGLKNSNGSKLEIEGIIWTAHEAITNHNNPK